MLKSHSNTLVKTKRNQKPRNNSTPLTVTSKGVELRLLGLFMTSVILAIKSRQLVIYRYSNTSPTSVSSNYRVAYSLSKQTMYCGTTTPRIFALPYSSATAPTPNSYISLLDNPYILIPMEHTNFIVVTTKNSKVQVVLDTSGTLSLSHSQDPSTATYWTGAYLGALNPYCLVAGDSDAYAFIDYTETSTNLEKSTGTLSGYTKFIYKAIFPDLNRLVLVGSSSRVGRFSYLSNGAGLTQLDFFDVSAAPTHNGAGRVRETTKYFLVYSINRTVNFFDVMTPNNQDYFHQYSRPSGAIRLVGMYNADQLLIANSNGLTEVYNYADMSFVGNVETGDYNSPNVAPHLVRSVYDQGSQFAFHCSSNGKPFVQRFGCDSRCDRCLGTLENQCTSCPSGHQIEGGGSTGYCEKICGEGEYRISRYVCGSCANNCKTCSGPTPAECSECKAPFKRMADMTCDSCASNCKTCTSAAVAGCSECLPSFVQMADKSCGTCPQNCAFCTSSTLCSVCKPPYLLQADKSCSLDDPSNCFDTL